MTKKKTPIKQNKNFLIILLSLILIIGLLIIINFYKQQNQLEIDTTTWNKHRNEVYSFEFKYPQPWTVVTHELKKEETTGDIWLINKPEYISDIDEYSFTKNDYSSIFIQITKFDVEVSLGSKNVIYDKNTDLKEYINERTGAPKSEIEKFKLNGMLGYMRTYKFGDRLDRQIFIKTDYGFLTLSYREGQNDINSTVRKDFLDIISTFKFVD